MNFIRTLEKLALLAVIVVRAEQQTNAELLDRPALYNKRIKRFLSKKLHTILTI